MSHPSVTPVTIAVAVSLLMAAIILSVTAAIGGSYALTIHAIHSSQNAQIVAAKTQCEALRALDQSHDGIKFPKVNEQHPSELALTRLFGGIHRVYTSGDCPAILSGHFKFP